MNTTAPTRPTVRQVSRIVPSLRTVEGGGFVVHRPFPTRLLMDFDPFLLLDEMGPTDYGPGEAKGAPDHPHRGFETVTYQLAGAFAHADSQGHRGALNPGDVQWMTAGSGIVHSEMPEPGFAQRGGRMHGLQLWVNLPSRDKMMAPRYQEIPSGQIPTASAQNGAIRVKVIAGEALGVKAAIATRTPILYQHFTLAPGTKLSHAVPADYRVFAYPLSGSGLFGLDEQGQAVNVGARHMVIFGNHGEQLDITAGPEAPLDFLLLGGVPLNEPVVRYGPFVMNSEAEIHQAVVDFQSGRMGCIAH